MYNVVFLKWGNKFVTEYVNRLYYGVRRNTKLPFKFHCFTEDSNGIDPDIQIHPLKYPQVPGWWQKLYLFSDEVEIDGRILFIDLDTLIVDNIDLYLAHQNGIALMQDLWRPQPGNYASAVMNFEVGAHTYLWNNFYPDHKRHIRLISPHGDQKWIIMNIKEQPLIWQKMYPNEIVSFESHCRAGVPKDAKIICYHGRPSIEESLTTTTKIQGFTIPPTPWVKEHWKDE